MPTRCKSSTTAWTPTFGAGRTVLPRQIGPHRIDPDTRIVTYVARGLESMRGFDIFMKLAKRIYQQMPNVLFVVVGADQVFYGGDLNYVKEKSFREYVLKQDEYNLSKIPLHRRRAARAVGAAALAQRSARLFDRALCIVMVACWMPWPAAAPLWHPTPSRCGR